MKKLIIMAALIIAATTTIASAQGIECPPGQVSYVIPGGGCACFNPGETSGPPCPGRSSIWDDVSGGIVGMR